MFNLFNKKLVRKNFRIVFKKHYALFYCSLIIDFTYNLDLTKTPIIREKYIGKLNYGDMDKEVAFQVLSSIDEEIFHETLTKLTQDHILEIEYYIFAKHKHFYEYNLENLTNNKSLNLIQRTNMLKVITDFNNETGLTFTEYFNTRSKKNEL